jgi:formylmethanofuran dehydrogenase subunit E
MKNFSLLTILLFICPVIMMGGEPPRHHVIIDTDGSPDDLRALNMVLSSPNTEVLAITSADGVLEPEEGFMKIQALLNTLGHQGIITSQGIISRNEVSPLRSIARAVPWGEEPISYSEPMEVKELLVKVIEQEEAPVEVISLGPLTNIANAVLMKPSVKSQISRIIWFDQCRSDIKWSNYGMDCLSADYLLGTRIPVYRIISDKELPLFNESFLEDIGNIPNPYAQHIYRSHSHDSLYHLIEKKELRIWNDLASLYLYYPEMFVRDQSFPDSAGHVMRVAKVDGVRDRILAHLNSQNNLGNAVFKHFPADSTLYRPDVGRLADKLIPRFGLREWRSITLTAELQGHLDITSVIGAKMGIRILDYFHTYPGQFNITSYCGLRPPLSSMNRGIQVACNATSGSGRFQIMDDNAHPRVEVRFKQRKIEVTLKDEYFEQLRDELKKIRTQHQYGTPSYWQVLREKSLQYWRNWNRNEIFRITEQGK